MGLVCVCVCVCVCGGGWGLWVFLKVGHIVNSRVCKTGVYYETSGFAIHPTTPTTLYTFAHQRATLNGVAARMYAVPFFSPPRR